MPRLATIDLEKRMLKNYKTASREILEAYTRSLAKVANSRLKALEDYSKKKSKTLGVQIDLTNYGAYKYAERMTKGRISTRFKTGYSKMSLKELRAEYEHIVTFLGMKTSLIQETTESIMKQYQDFLELSSSERTPFDDEYLLESEEGLIQAEPISFSDYWHLLERAWNSLLKEIFGSEVVAVALSTGNLNVLEEIQREVERDFAKQGKVPYVSGGSRTTPTDDFEAEAIIKLVKHPIGRKLSVAAKNFKSKRSR